VQNEIVAIALGGFVGVVLATLAIAVAWKTAEYIPLVAASLGFSKTPNYEVRVTGQGNIVTLPSPDKKGSATDDTFLMVMSEKCNSENAIGAFDNARFRILDHISKLRNNSVTNLFIGIGIAVIGVIILFTAIFQIDSFSDPTSHRFDTSGFLTFALLPKLSTTLFVQIFAYFFLAMYRSNQNEIRYFQNEITNIDAGAAATILYLQDKTAANAKIVLAALAKTERNRILKKNERAISDPDDADIIRAMSLISRSNYAIDRGTRTQGRRRSKKELE